MRGSVGSRWGAKVAAFFVALGLVLAGIIAPASAETAGGEVTESEDGITVTPSRDRWWYGQQVSFEVEVVREGQPASGFVRLVREASGGTVSRVRLTDGRATIDRAPFGPGTWTLNFIHESIDPETSQWIVHFSTSLEVLVERPATPVLSPTSWYVGESHPLRFDLTGTDEPQTGVVTFETPAGDSLQAELVDGVATFPQDATGLFTSGWRYVAFQHRDAATGELVAQWRLAVNVYRKPVELTVSMPSTWQCGGTVTIPVSVSSPAGGVPEGMVKVRSETWNRLLASGGLVDGKATFTVPATSVPLGQRKIVVSFAPSTSEFDGASRTATVTVQKRPTTVAVRTADFWTYAQPRRVTVTVTSAGAMPTGTVELFWAQTGKRIGTGTLVDGKVSMVVRGKKVDAGRWRIVAKYLGTPTFAPSQRAWSQRVRMARPTVRLSLDRTRIAYNDRYDKYVYGTVTVSTPNLPEVGTLCFKQRDPSDDDDRWSWCYALGQASTRMRLADDGKKRVRIPGFILGRDDNRTGPIYLRYVFSHRNYNVRTVSSNVVDLVLYH